MIVLPSIALFAFIFLLPLVQTRPKPTLTLVSVATSKVLKPLPNGPDVEVTARFNYSQSLLERLRPNWSMGFKEAYIVDGAGKKSYMMTTSELSSVSIAAGGFSRDFMVFPLWLRYFPKSAGQLTLHFSAIADDGYELPVSVVVRK